MSTESDQLSSGRLGTKVWFLCTERQRHKIPKTVSRGTFEGPSVFGFGVYLVDGSESGGVIVQVVGVNSQLRAEFHHHVSNALFSSPLLESGLQVHVELPEAQTHSHA